MRSFDDYLKELQKGLSRTISAQETKDIVKELRSHLTFSKAAYEEEGMESEAAEHAAVAAIGEAGRVAKVLSAVHLPSSGEKEKSPRLLWLIPAAAFALAAGFYSLLDVFESPFLIAALGLTIVALCVGFSLTRKARKTFPWRILMGMAAVATFVGTGLGFASLVVNPEGGVFGKVSQARTIQRAVHSVASASALINRIETDYAKPLMKSGHMFAPIVSPSANGTWTLREVEVGGAATFREVRKSSYRRLVELLQTQSQYLPSANAGASDGGLHPMHFYLALYSATICLVLLLVCNGITFGLTALLDLARRKRRVPG